MSESFANQFETDEYQDAIVSLELVAELLPKTLSNVHVWKWVVIALHNALQGFMVLALKGSDNLRPLTNKSAQGWLEAYERGDGSYPERRLDWFPSLHEKIKSDAMEMYTNSKSFVPVNNQETSIEKLNELRGNFVHFTPKHWLIDISIFPAMVIDIIDVIEFLGFESNKVVWYKEDRAAKTKMFLKMIRSQASSLQAQTGA